MNENIRLPKIAIPHRYEINLDINLDEFSYTGKEVVFLEIVDETKELQFHSLGIDIENAFIENDSGEHIEASINYLPCLLYTSPSPRDATLSRMPSSA